MSTSYDILSGLFEHDEVLRFVNVAKRRFNKGEASYARFHVDPNWRQHRYRDQRGRFTSGDEIAARVQQELAELTEKQNLPWSVDVRNLNVLADGEIVARGLLLTASSK